MATIAGNIDDTRKGPTRAPISAHPAFPAVVALWFAALLGIGSLILPTVLLERMTSVTGLAELLPAAAAPLGFTARVSIALAAALVGAILGLLLAVQVAKGQAPKPRPRFSTGDARQCRPISAHEELGAEGLGTAADPAQPQKRRSLAIAEENQRSDYLISVPLPGENFHAQAVSEPEEPLELGDYAEAADSVDEHELQDNSMADQPDPSRNFDSSRDEAAEPDFKGSAEIRSSALPRAFKPLPEDDLDDHLGATDALPFAPPSLRRTVDIAADDHAASANGQAEIEALEFVPEMTSIDIAEAKISATPKMSLVESEPGGVGEADTDRPIDELGLVQLATRLGKAIEQRRAQRAKPLRSAPRPAFSACDEDFDVAAEDDAAQARAEFFGRSARVEALGENLAVEPETPSDSAKFVSGNARLDADELDCGEQDEDEDDFTASFTLPLRRQSPEERVPNAAIVSDDEDTDGGDVTGEEDYSSLLAMRNPFERKDEFVRVEMPEDEADDFETTVTFPEARTDEVQGGPRLFDPPPGVGTPKPSAGTRNPADAERELRAALETLQRMSGAA